MKAKQQLTTASAPSSTVADRIGQLQQHKLEQQERKDHARRVKESWTKFIAWFQTLNSEHQFDAVRALQAAIQQELAGQEKQ
jgi:hypothetical protein